MFRIHRVFDATTPTNRELVAQVQAMLRAQFPGAPEADVESLPARLVDPFKYRFRSILLVAEKAGSVRGFAWLLHAPDLGFCYLDYLSAGRTYTGGGVGGALYQRVREEAWQLGVAGLFFEALPDDPALSPDPAVRRQNAARLRFYERFGARPIANTDYATPLTPGQPDPPYLVFDDLGQKDRPLGRAQARRIVRAILERKYRGLCPPEYVERVVRSFRDDPVKLREPRYVSVEAVAATPPPGMPKIALVVNDGHSIHHVKEVGYVEAPVRIASILRELNRTDLFERRAPSHYGLGHIEAVHAPEFVRFLKRACANVPPGKSIYPYVFPIRNRARPPRSLPLRAGYYCIDTFTPLNENAWRAALGAVDCALTAAERLLDGARAAYALVRPPGHHAERAAFGGFCYFNSAAVAAHYLSRQGRVALLDLDYHHGNGSQDIFWRRGDVLTLSLHGHPRHTYPYFSGYGDETGEGAGRGCNVNRPLPEGIDGERYRVELDRALDAICRFAPDFLVLALGFDTAKHDPTGSFRLLARDFRANGRRCAALGLPVLVVQEGGYRTQTLGANARGFFTGLWEGLSDARASAARR